MSLTSKAAYIANQSARSREQRRAMSPRQRAEHRIKTSARYSDMSPSRKAAYNARGRERYHTMSPSKKAAYVIKANDRAHKSQVLKKLRASEAYQDADPRQRQQMEEMIVEIAMEQRTAKRALEAVKEPTEPELIREKALEPQSRGEEIAASLISSFSRRVLEKIRQRECESRERKSKARRKRKSADWQS